MPRDPRFDILFESVQIGPLTTRNRFFQVPHCTGMGHMMPRSDAAMRRMKAEGGWSVICTEQCSFHPHAEAAPYPETKMWDQDDVLINNTCFTTRQKIFLKHTRILLFF